MSTRSAAQDSAQAEARDQTCPVVSVIIVSYNTREMTLDCLRTLYSSLDGISAEVWLVDNASHDGSVEAVKEAFPQVQIIANTANSGFGAANNQALKQARGEFLLLLNSDAFPKERAIGKLVDYMRSNPDVAVVGPQLLNGDGSLQRSCWKFPSPGRAWLENLGVTSLLPNHPLVGDYSRWEHDRERDVDFIIGACMLVRREAYERVGGFDEGFFLYSEETDWQRRMRDNGFRIVFTPSAQVTHLGGASGAAEKAKVNRHFFESLDRYEYKHHGLAGLISLRLAMSVGCLLRTILWTVVMVAVPKKRAIAASRSRFSSWLLVRQATCWPVALEKPKSGTE
jgi:GT2 family glycosyltransferase